MNDGEIRLKSLNDRGQFLPNQEETGTMSGLIGGYSGLKAD